MAVVLHNVLNKGLQRYFHPRRNEYGSVVGRDIGSYIESVIRRHRIGVGAHEVGLTNLREPFASCFAVCPE